MLFKKKWLWEVYSFILLFSVLRRAWNFFSPSSPIYLYFYLLKAFHPFYTFLYAVNVWQIFLSVIHILPLVLFIYRVPFGNPKFWQYLFILRIIFDLAGNSYECDTVISFYHEDPLLGLAILIQSISTYIPSYIACYQYAFKQ